MRWEEIGSLPCSVARALSVVGDRWTILVLRDAFLGAHRFEQFETSLGCSPHLLSTRLAKLVESGVLERRAYQQRPTRHEYRLTDKGRDLYPVIAALLRWGDRWMQEGDATMHLVHRSCGHHTTPTLTCSVCNEELTARNVRATLGGASPGTERNAS